jgi:two-component system, OmpR family, sensor histidine kinase KdpD
MVLRVFTRFADERTRLPHFLYGAGFVAVVSVIGEVAPRDVTEMHLALIYLLAVFIAAIRLGLLPAMFAALLSVAALDYLFLPPLYSLRSTHPRTQS